MHLHSNPEHFHTVRYIYANNKKGNVLLRFEGNNGHANTPRNAAHTVLYFRSQQHIAVGKAANRRMGVTAIQIAADNLVVTEDKDWNRDGDE